MARKSRKQNNQIEPHRHDPLFIQVAAYVRLSLDDRSKKGDSIETQKHMISNYINENPDFKLYDTYIDINISGATFERPDFQRLMRDAETGKINCVIVKDLSRLGRNVIDTGYYVEEIFRKLGLRLISINDNYDSSNSERDIRLPLINLLNEAYLLDISRKRRSQARQSMRDGIYTGGHPPYGYIRSSDDYHNLIVDTSAAIIVKQIFEWATDGVSAYEIARKLNILKIPSPNTHKNKLNTTDKKIMGRWCSRTIEHILENEIYSGNLIQGKTKTTDFQRKSAPTSEWIYAYNTHIAIISPEIFQAIQSLRQKKHEDSKNMPAVSYTTNIYKGKIYCAHCSGRMERAKNHNNYIFRCITNRTLPDSCKGNRIHEATLDNAVSEQLTQLKDKLLAHQNTQSKEAEILSEIRFIEMELSHLKPLSRSLYENLITGIINQTDYSELKSNYQGKIDEFTQRANMLQQLLDDEKRSNRDIHESLRMLDIFADNQIVTFECIDRFVDRIIIFNDGNIHVDWVK